MLSVIYGPALIIGGGGNIDLTFNNLDFGFDTVFKGEKLSLYVIFIIKVPCPTIALGAIKQGCL